MIVFGYDMDLAVAAEWGAASLFVVMVVTVPLRYGWFLVQRHTTPLRVALRPFERLFTFAATLAIVAAAAYGGWIVVEGWGVLWLVIWLLPAVTATAATPLIQAVQARTVPQPRYRRRRVWRAWAHFWLKRLRASEAGRIANEATLTKKKRNQERWMRRSVLRYALWRDEKRCGGCGNDRTKPKHALLSNVAPQQFGNFDVDERRVADENGTEWIARKDDIDNVQAACTRRCRASGTNTEKWRHRLLGRLPVATSEDGQRYLCLPWDPPVRRR